MNYITGIQNAIAYVEAHLTEEIHVEQVAREAAMSTYYFQRIFGILCGVTLGDYIRFRRLTLAGIDLSHHDVKIIDVALKYGYDTPESFTRAFTKFHGIPPRAVKSSQEKLTHFSRLSIQISLQGGNTMNYKIIEKPSMILTGYKTHFEGVPYGSERATQEENLFVTTRAKQWLLRGAAGSSADSNIEICVIQNIDGHGYDFYYTAELDQYERDNLFDPTITGIDFMERFGFENIRIPAQTYAVFSTEKQASPVENYVTLRGAIAHEIIANDDLIIADAPELALYHWYDRKNREKRYIEVWIPIVKK